MPKFSSIKLIIITVIFVILTKVSLILAKGNSWLSDAELQSVNEKYGLTAFKRVKAWQALESKYIHAKEADKIKQVNDFFNEVAFVSDAKHWGKKDYWATPIEMLATNGGDCEDFSIAKYFTLKKLGVAEEKMRLTYVKSLKLKQAHMVLAYYPKQDAVPLILDNLIKVIRPATKRPDLLPVYSFNGDGLWLAKERGKGRFVGNSQRLSKWVDLRKRLTENP